MALYSLAHLINQGTLSIECEDPFLTPEDTLTTTADLLRGFLPADPAPGVDWASRVAFKQEVSGLAGD